jgi:hypothetical protein
MQGAGLIVALQPRRQHGIEMDMGIDQRATH